MFSFILSYFVAAIWPIARTVDAWCRRTTYKHLGVTEWDFSA